MLKFHHAHLSRSGGVHWLLKELDVPFELVRTDIRRRDGSGSRDPNNPHPDGKVPALEQDGELVTETAAIMLYLTDLYPERRLGFMPGEPGRGAYLTWLFWCAGVVELVFTADMLGVGDHPDVVAAYRSRAEVGARLASALRGRPWLMGERFTAADIMLSAPFIHFPDWTPDVPFLRDWVKRCMARPAFKAAQEAD